MEKRDTRGIQERKNRDGTSSYRAQLRLRGFPHLSETFPRKADAKKWLEYTRAAIRGGNAVPSDPRHITLREALERYLREITPTKKGARRERDRVRAWMKSPLAVRSLTQLLEADFAKHCDERRAQGRAPNTIRIELALINTLYKTAVRDWSIKGLRNPIQSMTMPGGSSPRSRRLAQNEEFALMKELIRRGPFMEPLASLAIETAMRQGELLSLTWGDINLPKRKAHVDPNRTSRPRDVPLSDRALEILIGLPRPTENSRPVFPIKQDFVIRAFKDACHAAGITDLRFQDLRHEAMSRICDKLPMHEAMRVSGYKTASMLMRYYSPKADNLAIHSG